MNRLIKNSVSLLLVLVLVISTCFTTVAAGAPSTYSKTYNSGERDEICTSLSGTSAASYYTGNYTYDKLDDLSSSSLLTTLRKLMTDTHSKITSYSDCKNYSDNTDCQNEDGTVVLLYTSYVATMSDFVSGNTGWNREHVWPQSLGGFSTSQAGSDLHHIRPDDVTTNSKRGNNKYGEVSSGSQATGSSLVGGMSGGVYSGGYFEPHDNVKGDVARICLYVYVRWGGQYSKCSSITNVFQSIDVLLNWCALDPVDTWEMGRNEVVQKIQGNRNVFIDYPELAWILFGREIPANMTTPSGEANNGNSGSTSCTHSATTLVNKVNATCGVDGYTGDSVCNDCGATVVKGEKIPATGNHSTVIKNVVGATCGSNGYTGDTCCVVCSAVVVKGSVINATGLHSFGEWVPDYTSGTKSRTCSGCGKTETASISAEECPHPTTELRNQKDATCGSDGYSGDTCCTACNQIMAGGELIPASGEHSYSDVIVVVSPTLFETGAGKKVCHDCAHEVDVIIPSLSTDADSFTIEQLLSYAESDAEKILILLTLGAGEGMIIDSING